MEALKEELRLSCPQLWKELWTKQETPAQSIPAGFRLSLNALMDTAAYSEFVWCVGVAAC